MIVAFSLDGVGGALQAWLSGHWFQLLQSIGIIAGLTFTGWNIRLVAKARQLSNLFELTKSHREIWSKVFGNPGLHRVLQRDLDLQVNPVTLEEQVFVTLMILHLSALFEARKSKSMPQLERLEDDLRDFMGLPIPQTVWTEMKHYQNAPFVAFVEAILGAPALLRHDIKQETDLTGKSLGVPEKRIGLQPGS